MKQIILGLLFISSSILSAQAATWTGKASYYAGGGLTASGARFNASGLTAAHRSLPFGTHLRVTNLGNGRTVQVTVNDRGPFIRSRMIDLSRGAADVLGFRRAGTAHVRIEVVQN